MISEIRKTYNDQFTVEKYHAFLDDISSTYQYTPPFRIAETPLFVPQLLKERLVEACSEINKTICHPKFKEWSQNALKDTELRVPGEDYNTRFLQMDFGVCRDENGDLFPQLIEVQGFPSLYFFQELLARKFKQHFAITETFSPHVNGLNTAAYLKLLQNTIVGDNDPQNVVLLEVEPEKQATCIDFLGAADYLGIKVLCISQLKKRGKDLFYINEKGREIPVYKIYNRVIFDELNQRNDLQRAFYFKDEVNVEWVGHPNWFFRISKYILPLLKSKYVPESLYLDELTKYPDDLQNYVLKPLYSFAGSGVNLNVTSDILDAIPNKQHFILQKKVKYEPVIQTPNDPAKCEIRLLMLWEKGDTEARIVNNLVRFTKGEMVGVKYNKNKDWVGASIGFFEP